MDRRRRLASRLAAVTAMSATAFVATSLGADAKESPLPYHSHQCPNGFYPVFYDEGIVSEQVHHLVEPSLMYLSDGWAYTSYALLPSLYTSNPIPLPGPVLHQVPAVGYQLYDAHVDVGCVVAGFGL